MRFSCGERRGKEKAVSEAACACLYCTPPHIQPARARTEINRFLLEASYLRVRLEDTLSKVFFSLRG